MQGQDPGGGARARGAPCCVGEGCYGAGAGAASPGPLEGIGRNRTLFSSKERKRGQDSSKARNEKKEMNPVPG